MKRLSFLLLLGLLISCTTDYNNYYYGKENLRWFICRGHEVVDFNLSRQTSNEKVFRIINIVQMLRTDKDMEDYIHTKSSKAKPNRNYLFQNYKADEKVEELNPEEFSAYYREKKMLEAQRIVNELEMN